MCRSLHVSVPASVFYVPSLESSYPPFIQGPRHSLIAGSRQGAAQTRPGASLAGPVVGGWARVRPPDLPVPPRVLVPLPLSPQPPHVFVLRSDSALLSPRRLCSSPPPPLNIPRAAGGAGEGSEPEAEGGDTSEGLRAEILLGEEVPS